MDILHIISILLEIVVVVVGLMLAVLKKKITDGVSYLPLLSMSFTM